jgi:hypothetical protein
MGAVAHHRSFANSVPFKKVLLNQMLDHFSLTRGLYRWQQPVAGLLPGGHSAPQALLLACSQ